MHLLLSASDIEDPKGKKIFLINLLFHESRTYGKTVSK